MPKLGRRSERAELDYRMAPDVLRKDAPFGNLDTPCLTTKIIGGRTCTIIEKHPVGVDYGNRIVTLQPIADKPNHLDPRTYGDNPAGYYNNVQPTALVNRRPDSKDVTRTHYKPLPPILANRTRNDMSTVFESEAWTGNRQPELAEETEYKTHYYTDMQSNEMDQKRFSSHRRDHLRVNQEEYEQLTKLLPSNVFLPSDPTNYTGCLPILQRLIAGEMEGASAKELKDVYLEASQHDKDLRGYCPLEVLDNCLHRHNCHIPDLRFVAAQHVDPSQPGKVNYERILLFLDEALKLRDRGEITQGSRTNSPKRQTDEMADTDSPRSDRPRYYMPNGESGVQTGSVYKDREVAKLLRTVEIELTKNSYYLDWTKWFNAFHKADRDHRDTLSASQIKDICYDFKLPLSDSIMTSMLALCEDNNRDGQYRWNDYLKFLSRVRPSNTGLPIPVSKRPLEYAKRIPEPVANWPKTDTSPERHSPRRDSPHREHREHSPHRGGYTDRVTTPNKAEVDTHRTASPIKREVDTHRTASPIKQEVQQIRENTPDLPVKTSARQGRPRTRQEYQNTGVNNRHRHSPSRRHRSSDKSPEWQIEQRRSSSPAPFDPSCRQTGERDRHNRSHGRHISNDYQRESQSPERHWSHNQTDNHSSFRDGDDAFNRHGRPLRDEQSGYSPSWLQEGQQKMSTSPPPHHRRFHERERNHRPDDMRILNRDSYDNYMSTWAQKQMRWSDSRNNRPQSYAEPRRPEADHPGRARPFSYNDNMSSGNEQFYTQQQLDIQPTPGRRNRSLSPIRQGHVSPDRGHQYPQTYRESYRVPNLDLYRDGYSQNYQTSYRERPQYLLDQPTPRAPSRFDGPPGGYTGRGYGNSPRDGYGGYDDQQRRGGGQQYRYDDGMKSDRNGQIEQLNSELKELESKYHMTQDAMRSHGKPWADRYIKMVQALYNSDVSHKGSLPRDLLLEIVGQYNDAFSLDLNVDDARMISMSPGNMDRSGMVLLKPFLTNLAGARMRSETGRQSHRY